MIVFTHNDMNAWINRATLDVDNTLINDMTATITIGSLIEGEYGTITAATYASPIVITSAGHGLSNGTQIVIVDCVGNEAANGVHTVANATTNTFELSGSTGNAALKLPANTVDYPRWFKVVSGIADEAYTYVSPGKYVNQSIQSDSDFLPETEYWAVVKSSNYGFQMQGKVRGKVRKLGSVI